MYLQLADKMPLRPGYTFVPYDESDESKGEYVRDDVVRAAMKVQGLSDDDVYLSGFFGSLWKGIKNVVTGVVKTGVALVTGNSGQQQQSAQPVTVNIPGVNQPLITTTQPNDLIFGMKKETALLVGGGAVALLLLMRK